MNNSLVKHHGGGLALTTELYLKTLLKVMLGLALASAQTVVWHTQYSAMNHQVVLHPRDHVKSPNWALICPNPLCLRKPQDFPLSGCGL